MATYELLLILLSFTVITSSPIYLFLRSKMVKNDFTYSKRHIFKVIILHMTAMLVVTLFHSGILFYLLKTVENIQTQRLQYFIFQTVLLGIALYGGGIYVASVLLEHFTTRINIKVINFKKTLQLLHGPISHILFEIAYMLAFWNIALIQKDLSILGTTQHLNLFSVVGVLVGVSFAFATIGNGTYLLFSIISLCLLPVFTSLVNNNSTGGAFTWGFMGASIITLIIFIFLRFITNRKIKIYQPINFFKQ